MYAYANPLCIIVGPPIGQPGASVDLTHRVSAVTFSNVDPGGFEIASMTLARLPKGVRPNADVRIMFGTEVAWHGRVNAIGEADQGVHQSFTVDCVGYGAVLTDCTTSMIYIDRDLSRWQPPGIVLQTTNLALNASLGDFSVVPDNTNGLPTILSSISGNWVSPKFPVVQAMYDAGVGNTIAAVHFDVAPGSSDVDPVGNINWSWTLFGAATDAFTSAVRSSELRAASQAWYWNITQNSNLLIDPNVATVNLAGPSGYRYVILDFRYNATPAGAQGSIYTLKWQRVIVFGPSGLTLLNPTNASACGFFPSQIALHALSVCPGAVNWVRQFIDSDPLSYVVLQSAYFDEVPAQQIIDDMAKVQAWHWGVWEPPIWSQQPSFYFCARPTNATVVVRRGSLSQLDAPKLQLDQLYSIAHVKYTDAAGTSGQSDVTITNPFIAEAGLTGREITVDMGNGTPSSSFTYGTLLLNLNIANARGSGSAIMPGRIDTVSGEKRPSCLLKAGRDRIRILDLPDSGPFDQIDTRRFDTFSVRRVESTLQGDGTLQTRVEFDGGADLMEVLTARLATASVIAGV